VRCAVESCRVPGRQRDPSAAAGRAASVAAFKACCGRRAAVTCCRRRAAGEAPLPSELAAGDMLQGTCCRRRAAGEAPTGGARRCLTHSAAAVRAPIRTPLAEEDVGDTTSQHAGWRRSEVGAWRGQERMRTRALQHMPRPGPPRGGAPPSGRGRSPACLMSTHAGEPGRQLWPATRAARCGN
jgi:hypothetical protein